MADLQPIALCADDYALTEGVSVGILEAVERGRLTAVSAMTTTACWPWSARRISPFVGSVEVGLHLNLTLGSPLSKAPRIAPAGLLPSAGRLMRGALARTLPAVEIQAEISRQLDAFETELGRVPEFVDGHWHVHVLPVVRGCLLAELERRGLAGRLWLRDSGDDLRRIVRRGLEAPKATIVAALAAGFGGEARRWGFAANDGFSGFSRFDPNGDYQAEFRRFLVARGRRHLVMCHPGRVDDALIGLDPATASRERELAFLLSDAFAERLAADGVRLAKLGG